MYQQIITTILRGAATYILVLFFARVIGRKLISQMTFFDFVVGVTLGSLSANLAMGTNNPTTTTALFVLTALVVITDFIHIKSYRFRKLVASEPVTVIDTGKIVEDNMKRIRLTTEELTMKLREKNIFNLADVEFAIMETDGMMSVLPKPEKTPLTPAHMNIQATSSGLMRDVVIDGNVMEENLLSIGLDTEWLQSQLDKRSIANASELFYAGVDGNKNLYVSKKNTGTKETPGKYGIE
jgi:uncharacterized membrane protein YcaP (DUF421 family)